MGQRARNPRRAQSVQTPTVRIKEAALTEKTEREAQEEEASAVAVEEGIFKR